jgi:RIO-like serine/threonine protein kinase
MVSIAKITSSGNIKFIDIYDGRIPLLAEVFHDKERYRDRLKTFEFFKDRKIVKKHEGKISVIIHKRVFVLPPVLSDERHLISDFLTTKEMLELERETKKFSKVVSKIVRNMNDISKTLAIKWILFVLENILFGSQ